MLVEAGDGILEPCSLTDMLDDQWPHYDCPWQGGDSNNDLGTTQR